MSAEAAPETPSGSLKDIETGSKLADKSNGSNRSKVENPPSNAQDQSFGSLNDLYLSESVGTMDTNSDSSQTSPSTGVMSDRVQRIASNIYAEFEAMIEAYGLPVVERLMPLVIGLLENLDELYKDQSAYHEEVYQLREQNSFMVGELEREKERRKQAELRLIHSEDAFEEERKSHDAKIEALTLSSRQAELKYQNMKDQFARMEAKEAEWKKESQRLHEHINELIRSKLDLADQVKFANRSLAKAPNKSGGAIRLGSSAAPALGITVELAGERDAQLHPSNENMYDATSGGFGFDEMPASDAENVPMDEELLDDPTSPTTVTGNHEIGAFAGMRREIDILIKENMELVETKNALNVVKDDLIAKVDSLHLENASLRESVSHLTHSRSTLQSELASTDQLLNDTRHELDQLRERMALSSHRFESAVPEAGTNSMHRKRFTRAEMARVLSERNQYKERLMELQDAVRLTETLRAGQKGYTELLVGLSAAAGGIGGPSGSSLTNSSAPIVPARPLQTLQNFFAALIAPNRNDSLVDRPETPTAESVKLRHSLSHSWVRLSQTLTASPIYGWSQGLDSPLSKRSPSTSRPSTDTINAQLQTVPVPVQCRTVGGLHGKQLEIVAAILIDVKRTQSEYQIWLIGRGPGRGGLTGGSPIAGGRGFVGQVHLFELSRFSQPLHSFDLDHGFMPTAAVFVDAVVDDKKSSSENSSATERSNVDNTVQFEWEILRSKPQSENQPSVGNLILASNDGRFLVLEVSADLQAQVAKAADSAGSPTQSLNMLAFAQFHVQNVSLVSNCMVSTDGIVCLSLSNPSGVSQLSVFRLADALNAASSSRKTELPHDLISIPGDCAATGPVVMALDESPSSNQSSLVWLGSAGGGFCHSFSLKTKQFVHSLRLPVETPCLHAICVQAPDADASYSRIWLAVSGISPASMDDGGEAAVARAYESRGMARLIAFRTDTQALVHQLDLTAPLCAMMDTEGVTDPIDLTLCRLLIVSFGLSQNIWFATRSGIIGRFPMPTVGASENANNKPQVPTASSLAISCHGYRRPVCNLISVKVTGGAGQELEQLVIAVGHDYVNLRPKQPRSPTRQSKTNHDASYKLRPMGSGAHTIVWKLNVASG